MRWSSQEGWLVALQKSGHGGRRGYKDESTKVVGNDCQKVLTIMEVKNG